MQAQAHSFCLSSNAWRPAALLYFSTHALTITGLRAGLYAERVGAINFVLSDSEAAKRVMSQLKRIARALYSNPPVHGRFLFVILLHIFFYILVRYFFLFSYVSSDLTFLQI